LPGYVKIRRLEMQHGKSMFVISSSALLVITLTACSRASIPPPTASLPLPTAIALATFPSPSPEAEPAAVRWIEVVLQEQTVYLWEDHNLVATLPVSSGVGGSPETTTHTGEFIVETMYQGPEQTVPGVYVRDIVIFDWEHGNGFHSLPMDADGKVLDPTIGKPASAGCIRVAESAMLYDFAEIGMKVIIR
jgi:lipoprotein-anchoring transpeptidase ErfK/SrfK